MICALIDGSNAFLGGVSSKEVEGRGGDVHCIRRGVEGGCALSVEWR